MTHLGSNPFPPFFNKRGSFLRLLFSCSFGFLFARPMSMAATTEPTHFFRTAESGSWHSISTWVASPDNGITPWVASTIFPDERAAGIVVLGNHTVVVTSSCMGANISIEQNGVLEVLAGTFRINNGAAEYDLLVHGQLVVSESGTLIGAGAGVHFTAGSRYVHRIDGKQIPIANWSSGSVCEIQGMIQLSPEGMGQSFSRFIWNCTDQVQPLLVNNPAFTVTDTLILSSTGTTSFIFAGATTQDYLYEIANIQIRQGKMQLSHRTTANDGKVTLSVAGSIHITNNANARFVFADGTVSPDAFSYMAEVLLAGNLMVEGSAASFHSASSLSLVQGRVVFKGSHQLLHIVTGGSSTRGKVDFLIEPNSNVQLMSSLHLFGNNRLEIFGTLDNNGENQIISGGGSPAPTVIIHGKFITRDEQGFTGTNAAIPGIVPSLSSGCTIEYGRLGNQSIQARTDYTNLVFSGSGTKTLVSTCIPAGEVCITNQAVFDQQNISFGNEQTQMRMDGGRWRMAGTGTKPDIRGGFDLSGGVIDFANRASTPQTIRGQTAAGSTISYYAIEISGNNVQNSNTNITLAAGGKFSILSQGVYRSTNNSIVGPQGIQEFVMMSGSTFICQTTDGFYGAASFPSPPSVRNDIEQVVLQQGSTIVFGRQGNQNIRAIATQPITDFENVEISGGGLKTLLSAITIKGQLTLSNGIVQSSSHNLLTLEANATCPSGGSSQSFVEGQLCKKGDASFMFPVGAIIGSTYHYRPIGIANITEPSNFIATFFRSSAAGWNITASGLQSVSNCEYWELQQTGSAKASVTLIWNEQSPCNVPEAYVTQPATTVVAQFAQDSWSSYSGSGTGQASPGEGSVTSDQQTYFYRFALGSTSVGQLVLPTVGNRLAVEQRDRGIFLKWELGAPDTISSIYLEHSSDGLHFSVIAFFPLVNGSLGRSNHYLHEKPIVGWNYYRLRAELKRGETYFSRVSPILFQKHFEMIRVYPNPATEKIFVYLSNPGSVQDIQIVNKSGLLLRRYIPTGSTTAIAVSDLGTGLYYLRFIGSDFVSTASFLKW